MAITLTEAAANHVKNFIAKRGKGVGLRLGVRTTGCSGLAYKLEFADEAGADDQQSRQQRQSAGAVDEEVGPQGPKPSEGGVHGSAHLENGHRARPRIGRARDRKSTRLNSSHG